MNLEFLRKFGFTAYDIGTLDYLIQHGRAAASDIAKRASIPTSKIYICLTKLEELGLVRLENNSPKIYSVVDNDQLIARLGILGQTTAVEFARNLQHLTEEVAHLAARNQVTSQSMLVADNAEDYFRKHLPRVAEAKQNVMTVWQTQIGPQDYLDTMYLPMYFGLEAPFQHMLLTDKLPAAGHPAATHLESRQSNYNFGGNFHLWDGSNVLLVIGNTFSGIKGSMLINDEVLYTKLTEGFMREWYTADAS